LLDQQQASTPMRTRAPSNRHRLAVSPDDKWRPLVSLTCVVSVFGPRESRDKGIHSEIDAQSTDGDWTQALWTCDDLGHG